MKRSIEQVLDTCLAQLHSGKDIETIVSAYPDMAGELRPLLAAAVWAHIEIPPPVMQDARRPAFLAAVEARRRVVAAADGYVNELKAGVPLSELLARAPAYMRPVIVAAWRMYSTPVPPPSPEKVARGRQRLMAMAARRRAARRVRQPAVWREALRSLAAGLLPAPTAGRRVWSGALALAAVLILSLGMAGIGTAAASLPGQPFYQVKRWGESARLLFTFDPERRADLNLKYSQRRLDEMMALVEAGRQVPLQLVEAWLRNHTQAWAEIRELPPDQKQQLAEALLASMAEQAQFEGRLRQAVADPAALEELLGWARSLADSARQTVGVEERPSAVTVPVPLHQAPRPVPRPLPAEEFESPPVRELEVPEVLTVVETETAASPEEQADQLPPPVVQPVNDEPAGEPEPVGAEPPPTEPTEAPPTVEPPPYVQPPVEEPGPGTAGAGGGAASGSAPQDPPP